MRWFGIALEELAAGIAEIPGPPSNPRVEQYHAAAGGAALDEVPWCSSFVNYCMKQAGMRGTDSKAARSWLKWGRQILAPQTGCVVVLSRTSNPALGHVGFFASRDPNRVLLLGGNQGDRVSLQWFDASRVLDWRWPA